MRALSYARLVTGCRPIAAAASIAASQKDANDEIGTALKTYGDDIVRELRADGDKRANAEQYYSIAAELVSLFFSPEEAEFLRRRGRAALGQVPAVVAA